MARPPELLDRLSSQSFTQIHFREIPFTLRKVSKRVCPNYCNITAAMETEDSSFSLSIGIIGSEIGIGIVDTVFESDGVFQLESYLVQEEIDVKLDRPLQS